MIQLQHLVDWSRGMVCQIGQLNDKYTDWVNKPVDRPLRLFDNHMLEMMTKTPWWLVPMIWTPVIAVIFYAGVQDATSRNYSNVNTIPMISFSYFGSNKSHSVSVYSTELCDLSNCIWTFPMDTDRIYVTSLAIPHRRTTSESSILYIPFPVARFTS